MLTFLESIPDELSLQILGNLKVQDLLACRLVSTSMCELIDRLFSPKFCIILNEKSEQHFLNSTARTPPHSLLTKNCINSKFNTMKVGSLACCSKRNQRSKQDDPHNIISLRIEQFTFITELEFSQFIRKSVFQEIIKITARNLRTLTINSAVLGGAGHLFGFNNGLDWKNDSNKLSKTNSNRNIIQRMFTLWKNLIPFGSLKGSRDTKPNQEPCYSFEDGESFTLLRLNELHIRITYVATTLERLFSPHVLVENMKGLRLLPVPNLQAYHVTVERSEDGELFYFTLNSLLQTIPVLAFGNLKSLFITTPKVKPLQTNMNSYCDYDHLAEFKMMKLSELTVRILDGYKCPRPEILRDLLSTQSATLKALTLAGFPDEIKVI